MRGRRPVVSEARTIRRPPPTMVKTPVGGTTSAASRRCSPVSELTVNLVQRLRRSSTLHLAAISLALSTLQCGNDDHDPAGDSASGGSGGAGSGAAGRGGATAGTGGGSGSGA